MDNKFFIKLVDEQQKVQFTDMFIHVSVENDTRFLYLSDKNKVLRKLNILDGREIWVCSINSDIKSICIDSNYTCYVTTNSNIRKISNDGKYISTLNIKSNKTICDEDSFYISKANKLSKITENGQEQVSYDLDSNINDIATDKIGNIYVATDKDVRKLVKKIIGDKDSKNVIRNSGEFINFNYWTHVGCNIYDDKQLYIKASDNVGDTYIQQLIQLKPNTTYTLSIEYDCGKGGSSSEDRWHSVILDKDNKPMTNIIFNNGKHRDSKTFITNNNTKYNLLLGGFKLKLGTVIIKNIQLEEGSQATPWIPNRFDYINIGEWKYSINANSLALDSENNIYISTSQNIQKLNSNGQKIDTLDIQADNIALDLEDNMYISRDKSVEKLNKGKKQWQYVDNNTITNIVI